MVFTKCICQNTWNSTIKVSAFYFKLCKFYLNDDLQSKIKSENKILLIESVSEKIAVIECLTMSTYDHYD